MVRENVIDRVVSFFSPAAGLARRRARVAAEMVRGFDAARPRRGGGGHFPSPGGPVADTVPDLAALRAKARDMARNNTFYRAAKHTVVRHEIGAGIVPASALAVRRPKGMSTVKARQIDKARMDAWKGHFEKTHADFHGRTNIYGLQALARGVAFDNGSSLVREHMLSSEQMRALGAPLPIQYQVLEPDYLDTARDGPIAGGGAIIGGVEFGPGGGRPRGYWFHRIHPGESTAWPTANTDSVFVPASQVIHLFKQERPGQVDGAPEAAASIIVLETHEDYLDAWGLRGKMEACLGLVLQDDDGAPPASLGEKKTDDEDGFDRVEFRPGMVVKLPAGKKATAILPTSSGGQVELSRVLLRSAAAGIGIGFDQISTDTSQANYSSTRAARLEFRAQVEQSQWHFLIPGLCEPMWAAMCRVGFLMGLWPDAPPEADWMPPRPQMVDPSVDVPAIREAIRIGILTQRQAIQEQGYNPDDQLVEIAAVNAAMDALGITLDSDPRRTSQQGQLQASLAPTDKAAPPSATPSPDTEPAPASGDEPQE